MNLTFKRQKIKKYLKKYFDTFLTLYSMKNTSFIKKLSAKRNIQLAIIPFAFISILPEILSDIYCFVFSKCYFSIETFSLKHSTFVEIIIIFLMVLISVLPYAVLISFFRPSKIVIKSKVISYYFFSLIFLYLCLKFLFNLAYPLIYPYVIDIVLAQSFDSMLGMTFMFAHLVQENLHNTLGSLLLLPFAIFFHYIGLRGLGLSYYQSVLFSLIYVYGLLTFSFFVTKLIDYDKIGDVFI